MQLGQGEHPKWDSASLHSGDDLRKSEGSAFGESWECNCYGRGQMDSQNFHTAFDNIGKWDLWLIWASILHYYPLRQERSYSPQEFIFSLSFFKETKSFSLLLLGLTSASHSSNLSPWHLVNQKWPPKLLWKSSKTNPVPKVKYRMRENDEFGKGQLISATLSFAFSLRSQSKNRKVLRGFLDASIQVTMSSPLWDSDPAVDVVNCGQVLVIFSNQSK